MPPPAPGTGVSGQFQRAAPSPELASLQGAIQAGDKSVVVAYLLCVSLGWFGVHQFYIGKTARGVGYLVTLAWFTIGWFVDLFTLPAQVKRVNIERRAGLR